MQTFRLWFKTVMVGETFYKDAVLTQIPQKLRKVSDTEALWFSDIPNRGDSERIPFSPRCQVLVEQGDNQTGNS